MSPFYLKVLILNPVWYIEDSGAGLLSGCWDESGSRSELSQVHERSDTLGHHHCRSKENRWFQLHTPVQIDYEKDTF